MSTVRQFYVVCDKCSKQSERQEVPAVESIAYRHSLRNDGWACRVKLVKAGVTERDLYDFCPKCAPTMRAQMANNPRRAQNPTFE